ncbi:hypothetical protein EGW08_020323 [Elysia chlorotica]|uniref:Tubulin epsilon and delta complex protein 1 domain-containing protein n=1 Tax=Elysia chlorotica TaxID=188477 RepID=A0A3S0ZP15_ELYCH|nr:hypothetical protein EGW08_020323 [Elysia chlorotica]
MSSKNGQARAINELLCTILEENHISFVRAETLRQAKFDKCSAAKSIGQLLFDVVCVCESDNVNQGLEFLKRMIPNENQMIFLKTKLQGWGYLSDSFAKLPNDFSTGSRELLLALGWVIYQQSFINKIIKRRSCPLHQDFVKFSKSKSGILKSPEEQSTKSRCDNLMCLKEKIQYHMMLTGKLRMSLRRLYSTYQQLTSFTYCIHQSTEGVHLQSAFNHLTPLEVHVLRHPGSLKKMLHELEKDNLELTHLLEWKQKENVFWEWMGSVLSAQIESQNRSGASSAASMYDDALPEPSVYLPIPENVDEQIRSARDHLRAVILKHEDEMSRVEQIVQRKKVSTVEAEIHKLHMDKELFEKTLQLRSCGIGEEKNSHQSINNKGTDESAASEKISAFASPFSGLNKDIMSPYAARASQQEALKKAINKEISSLKEKVEKLQTDLRKTQLQNMEDVQRLINNDSNVICIQPRSLKHFYE